MICTLSLVMTQTCPLLRKDQHLWVDSFHRAFIVTGFYSYHSLLQLLVFGCVIIIEFLHFSESFLGIQLLVISGVSIFGEVMLNM